MTGIVYLKTNRFEVKLEGITFKAKDFETLYTMDFLFPDGKIWARPPIVGLDIMHHPRDPSAVLLLLCIGVGCVILRFRSGESLPDPILKFLTDDRICFVGFGIPEKKDLFPFDELGLNKKRVDIGYIAVKHLNNHKYKRSELGELARKVLGIKRMIGLTDASSFERHEKIKCAICQVFITSLIAMAILGSKDKKTLDYSSKKGSLLKNLNAFSLSEGWFNLPKLKTVNNQSQVVEKECKDYVKRVDKGDKNNSYVQTPRRDEENETSDDCQKGIDLKTKRPVKGILKFPPYSGMDLNKNNCVNLDSSGTEEQNTSRGLLRRANSKGCNVSFKTLIDVSE